MSKKLKKYLIQYRYGNNSPWRDDRRIGDFDKATQRCEQLYKSNCRPQSNQWYKTRVVIENYGKFNRVYPPKKKSGE